VPERAALYVDGFNFYHAVNDLAEPHLKWVNLAALGRLIIPRDSSLARVVYCSAYYPDDDKKRWRHRQFVMAQQRLNAHWVEGHYVHEPKECNSCGDQWRQPAEKQGDINVAIHLINDAWLDRYDHAYLLSGDSDQAATARLFKSQFPDKKLTAVTPPGRPHSKHITAYTARSIALTRDHIAKCLLPAVLLDQIEGKHIRRPVEYDPPPGWQAP
jgi:hypothetical protein